MAYTRKFATGFIRTVQHIHYHMKHGRNFVVKCGGAAWCETNIVIGSMQKWRFTYTEYQSYF